MTGEIERRLREHNETGMKGFTKRYRPWTLCYTEEFASKAEAMAREKYFKTGRGRDEIKNILKSFLGKDGAVSAAAEKD